MAASKTAVNPYIRRSTGQRLAEAGRYVLRLPRMGVEAVRGWPKPFRRLVFGLGLVVALLLSIFGGREFIKRSREQKIKLEWVAIDNLKKTTRDRQEILDHLNAILAIRPDDQLALSQKNAIESGQGDPADAVLMTIIIQDHLKNKRINELVRECEKRLGHEPRDYYAHLLLAQTFLDRGDAAAAEPHLVALANPELNRVNMPIGVLPGVVQKLAVMQRDTLRLRTFLSDWVLAEIRKTSLANSDPEYQILALEIYPDTFFMPKIPTDAGQTWPAAQEIANLCLEGASKRGSIDIIRRLGRLGRAFAEALVRSRNIGQISHLKMQDLVAQNEQRTQKAWRAVLEREEKSADAYCGLVMSYSRAGQHREANDALSRGLEVCKDDPQLLEIFTTYKVTTGNAMLSYRALRETAERNPTYPRYWYMAAHAAIAADRRDLAIEALETGRKALPNDHEFQIRLADTWSGTGHPEKVLRILSTIRDVDLPAHFVPRASEVFAQALAEIGDEERLEHFLTACYEVSRKSNNAQQACGAARGLLNARPARADRATKAADYLFKVVEQWRAESGQASILYAEALVAVSELKAGPPDPVAGRNAIMACERALARDATHIATVTNLVRFRLRFDRDAVRALRESEQLLAHIDNLTQEQVETLAMVFNANKRYGDAVSVLQNYSSSNMSGGCWVQLAVGYHGQGRQNDAMAALQSASECIMSPRERAEYLAARELLSRAKS